jgi:hypothetical protein
VTDRPRDGARSLLSSRDKQRGGFMHAVAALGIVVWFVLVALLWYARPGDIVWLAGSLVLGFVFATGMFWYVTRPK